MMVLVHFHLVAGGVARRHHLSPTVAMRPAGQDPELLRVPGSVTVPLRSQPNASPFRIMLLLVSGRPEHGMIEGAKQSWRDQPVQVRRR
jgi:hypothetical protein